MPIRYPEFTPERMRYQYCPICTTALVETSERNDLPRPQCPACGWTYYPDNLQSVNVVITTPEGVVFVFPPGEPEEAPAALPGGAVEFGETPEESAVRVAREETGLDVALVRQVGRHFRRGHSRGPLLTFVFEARAVGGTLVALGPEGRVVVFPEGQFPAISPERKGSQRALEAYLEAREA